MFLESKWWEFCIVAFFIFLVCVVVSYIMKKVNEARIEERLSRLLQKTSVSTQVQEPILAAESIKTKALRTITHSNNSTRFTGISLVFNKEENILLGIKRKASTLLAIKSKSKNLEEILEVTQNEEDALYRKISIISVDKNKTDQTRTKYSSAETKSMIIKDSKYSNEIYIPNSNSSRLFVKQKEFVQKVSSGSLKLLKLDCKLNLSKYKSRSNNIEVNNSDNLTEEKPDKTPTNVESIKAISQELSTEDLASLRLEAKCANYNLECNKPDVLNDTKKDSEPCKSNLKQEMWHCGSSLTKSEFGLCKSKQTISNLGLITKKLDNRALKSNGDNDSNIDNHDSVVSKVPSSKDKRSKEDETTEMLSQIISSQCLTTHKLEAKMGKANISAKIPANSELDILAERHQSNNVVKTNSQAAVTVNPILLYNDLQPGENDPVSLLKHSMWHPNNCITITDSHVPSKSKEIVVIDAGEAANQTVALKNESQSSYASTHCQHVRDDLKENIHEVKSYEINITDSLKITSEPRALLDKDSVNTFREIANDENTSNNKDSNVDIKSLEINTGHNDGPRGVVVLVTDCRSRGRGFDSRSGQSFV